MEEYYLKYEEIKGETLTIEEYIILLITYPAFSVAIADGHFDSDEKSLMGSIVRNIVTEVYQELGVEEINSLIAAYMSDFDKVYQDDVLRKVVESGLIEYSKENSEVKQSINELMQDMAATSEGVSEEEQAEIDRINLILH